MLKNIMKPNILIAIIVILLGLGFVTYNELKPKSITTQTSIVVDSLPLTLYSNIQFTNAKVYCFDSKYTTVNLEWLQKTYYKEFKKELFKDGVVNWVGSFDCDKFSRFYSIYLQTKFLLEHFADRTGPQSVAVGNLFYYIGADEKKGHAINIIFKEDNTFVYLEPQTGELVTLTEMERDSVFLILW